MEFKDLLDLAQAQAISNTLEHTEVSVWRSICRSYSKKFATPLHLCLDGTIPMEDVMLAVYEEQLENFDEENDIDNILDTIYTIEDPDYEQQKKYELGEFIHKAEREEAERIKAGKPIHKAMKDEESWPTEKTLPKKVKPKKLPKSGGINLSYLEAEEKDSKGFE